MNHQTAEIVVPSRDRLAQHAVAAPPGASVARSSSAACGRWADGATHIQRAAALITRAAHRSADAYADLLRSFMGDVACGAGCQARPVSPRRDE